MAIVSKTDLKTRIAANKLVKQILIDVVDSYIDITGPLDFSPEAIIKVDGDTKLTIDTNGRVYGTAIHDNSTLPTGTTNQYVASGTYTPSISNIFNATGVTARKFQWIRVGNVVHVTGNIIFTPSAASPLSMEIALPIGSNLAQQSDCSGCATTYVDERAYAIYAEATNNNAKLQGYPATTTLKDYLIVFSYEIL